MKNTERNEERPAAARREERMLALCRAFLAKRRLVAAAFLAAAALLVCCIPLVKVNYSLTDYLPADAASVQSLDQMEESFGGGVPNARLYAEGIGVAQAQRAFPRPLPKSTASTRSCGSAAWPTSKRRCR